MADDPLTNLANQLKQAAPGLALNADFLAGALGGGVALPANLDTNLAHAFHPGTDGGLAIAFTANAVQAVSGSTLTVTPVGFTAQSAAVTGATLTFTIGSGANGPLLDLRIVAPAPDWTWTNMSPFAVGWPFSWAVVSGASLTFDTSVGGAVQTLSAGLTPPAAFEAIAGLIPGLSYPSDSLPLAGQLDFAAVDAATVLFPEGRLEAPLGAAGPFKIFSTLNIQNPRIAITLPAQVPLPPLDEDDAAALEEDFAGAEDEIPDPPSIDLSVDLMVGTASDVKPYIWSALVQPGSGSGPTSYRFGLTVPPGASQLTPSAIMGLVGGASYFEQVPAEFQGFLSSVSLRGFNLDGFVNPASVQQITVLLGAGALLPWTPLNDDNGLKLVIKDLQFQWTISDPFGSNRRQSILFTTEAQLPFFDGTFTFEITSSLQFDAEFDGTIQLSTMVRDLSMGQIVLPDGLDASLSGIHFRYDHVSGSYAFSAGVEIDLSFIKIGSQPLFTLAGGSFMLAASRSPTAPGPNQNAIATTTIYQGSFGGMVSIVGVHAIAEVSYQTGVGWQISAALAQPVPLKGLIEEVFTLGGSYTLPAFFPSDLTVDSLSVDATRPTTGASTYTVAAAFTWKLALGSLPSETIGAQISIDHDGTATTGSVAAQLSDFLGASLGVTYVLQPGGDATLSATWEGVTATYSSGEDSLTFTLAGWSLGSLITALVKTIPDLDPYFTLPAPFDLLNDVPLDGLRIVFDLGADSGTISASYPLSSPLELGFASIGGLRFTRYRANALGKHQLLLQLIGSSPILKAPLMVASAEDSDAAGAAPGVAVDKLPTAAVPGQGNKYFKLNLFAMGQRVKIAGMEDAPDVKTMLANLRTAKSTDTETSPVGTSQSHAGTPYYDRDSDWLIAARMQILKAGDDWTIDLGFVFHDSDLYGLHLEMAGTKAKALAGLVIDVLYKKVTDEIGMYQVDWRFPDAVRNLNFGAVSVVLPDIGVQIYTNGDFMIDIGFPYKMDFSHSFSFSVIIAGIPVTGAGGVYFGKLSGATSTFTPPTKLGVFNPVIVFGVGFQVGLGYSFTAGPLSAGFSLTAFAMIEGVIAAWHAYPPATPPPPPPPGPPPPTSVQHDYYFKISGTVGVIGLLYGTIDFAIIKASLSVNITLSLSLTYQSFQPMTIEASASVTVELRVSIDLGLFSIHFHLSFHADVHAGFVIHIDDGTAPWIGSAGTGQRLRLAAAAALPPMPRAPGRARPVLRIAAKPALKLFATAAHTVTAAEGETVAANQIGAFVTLLMMDAPSLNGTAPTGKTSFDLLCHDLLPWLTVHLADLPGDAADLDAAAKAAVTPDLLQTYMNLLADLADPPLLFADYLLFLSSFKVSLQALTDDNKGPLEVGTVPIPPFDGLTATASLNGVAGTPIDFSAYVTVEPGYRDGIAALFETLAATLEKAGAPPPVLMPPRPAAPSETPQSMASMLFVDMMMVTGRQLLQAAKNAFRKFQLTLTAANNSIAGILAWSQTDGTADGLGITSDDVVLPNAATALAGGIFTINPPPYTILNGDTLASIAAAFPSSGQISAVSLIAGNPNAHVIAAGLTLSGQSGPLTTTAGMSFAQLQAALGAPLTPWTPVQLGAAIATAQSLIAGATIELRLDPAVSALVIHVAAGDTLGALAARYGVTVSALGAEAANQAILPLFDAGVTTVPLTGITKAPVGQLRDLIVADDQIATIAGIVSRFMAAGLRLPKSTAKGSLTLSDAFNGNNPGQDHYGLYQLTGQQFPAAPASPAPGAGKYQLVLSRLEGALGFITFDTEAGSIVDLVEPLVALGAMLGVAQAGAFSPATSFRILPAVARAPRLSACSTGVGFVSADPKAIATLTAAEGTLPSGSGVRQPMLWMLPPSLLADASARQQAFDAARIGYVAQLAYLQLLQPVALGTDPATKLPVQTDLTQYAWATRVEFSVKRLPPAASGAAAAKTRAFTYELVALGASQASVLERLVSALAAPAAAPAISGIFLAYPQGGGANAQLMAPADPDSPAFFSRTNLSTQSNPDLGERAAQAPAPPPAPPIGNLANPPAQIVRMLWELSTVRSGGYFLSWDQLPDAAFDSSGKADLALIVTYKRGGVTASLGDRLTAFVNALLTDDPSASPGVQVALESQCSLASAQPIAGASLARVASLYGLSAGRVAELNAAFPLVPGVTIQIGGMTSVVDGAPVYGPTVAYPIVAGDTLQSIAAAHGISIDDLATGAAAAAILASPSPVDPAMTLIIDPQALDVRPSDASGNVTFELSRPAPDPLDLSPQSRLDQNFTMLAAGVKANAYFTASDGAPFGPQKHDDAMDPATARRVAARRLAFADPARRRAALRDAAPATLCYRQALGLTGVALSNVAPAGGTGGAPDGADNPYKGVGTLAQLALEWRDLFGNILVDQFGTPPAGYSGPVSGQIIPLLYRDKLIGPAAWPNLRIHYCYDEGELNIVPSLSIQAYAGSGAEAIAAAGRDQAIYRRIWYQLNQDYSDAGIPWADGEAVQFALHTDLLAVPDLALDDAQAGTFRTFVDQVLAYLDQRQQGQAGTIPSVPALGIPIDVATGVAAGEILPLALTLTLSRPGLLVDSALAGLADAEAASVDLLPMPDALDDAASGYSRFASLFEAMFVSAAGGWTMRVGTSAATAAAAGQGDWRMQSLWAVRFADTPLAAAPQGLGFALADLPLYYAPLPLAQSLLSAAIDLYPAFDAGQSFPPHSGKASQTFTGVDPNTWFQTVLDAIDTALSPDLAAALYLLDLSQGVADPMDPDPVTGGRLGQLLALKQGIAGDIADTVRPILEPAGAPGTWPVPDDASKAAAAETLRQSLLNQLGPAFGTTAILAFQATQVAGGAVNLFGKPSAALAPDADSKANATFSLSSARLSLDTSDFAPLPWLAFLLNSRNPAAGASYLPLTMTWDITHVEHGMRSIPGIEGYVDSDWIAFVTAPAQLRATPEASPFRFEFNQGGEIDVPVLLRALPQPPTMRGQSATATFAAPALPSELAQWDYEIDFVYDRAAQDTIATEIDLNTSAPDSGNGMSKPAGSAAARLYQALAQFVQVYPAVEAAMSAALQNVTGDGASDGAAAIPVQWFLALLGDVGRAYGEWVHPIEQTAVDAPTPPGARISFEIELVPADPADTAVVRINGLAVNGTPATLEPDLATINAGGIDLPLPVVQILPGQYEARVVSAAGPGPVEFNYVPVASGTSPAAMTYEVASGVPARSVIMSGLDIFDYRNGTATLRIIRNENLLPGAAPPPTNPVFTFSTPDVQYATPAAPSLAFPAFPVDSLQPSGSRYQSFLEAFFTGLAGGSTGDTPVEAAATMTYSYSLIPDQAPSPSPAFPRTVVPVTLLLHTPAVISARAAPSFAAPLAAATDLWRHTARPTTGGGATIDMMLAIYPAGDGNLQPMLRVESVSVEATNALLSEPDA
jgi:LysM repeat protein